MRALILVAGAALALSACGGNDTTENTLNVDENLAAENFGAENVVIDANNVSIVGNGTENADANAIATDLTTNDADTNLANGM